MDTVTNANRLRALHFAIGALANQQYDPVCSSCHAFAVSAEAAMKALEELNVSAAYLPAELASMIGAAKVKAASIRMPAEAIGQKKAGACALPEGLCFSKAVMEIKTKAEAS